MTRVLLRHKDSSWGEGSRAAPCRRCIAMAPGFYRGLHPLSRDPARAEDELRSCRRRWEGEAPIKAAHHTRRPLESPMRPEVPVPVDAALQVVPLEMAAEQSLSRSQHRNASAMVPLARRYYRLRLLSVPFAQWHFRAVSKRPKRRNEETQRLCLALRTWRRKSRRPRLGRSLVKLVLGRLRHAFLQLQGPVLQRRLQLAKAMMLKILHRQTRLRMAAVWWQQAWV
eukprot:s90_g40.t1